MNQKKKIENYQQIAMGTGLRYDETNDLLVNWKIKFQSIHPKTGT